MTLNEAVAEPLGRTPKVDVVRVIEVRFLRGAGIVGDPVREVVALFREDGSPIVELDPHMGDEPDGDCQGTHPYIWHPPRTLGGEAGNRPPPPPPPDRG